jgi:phage protein D
MVSGSASNSTAVVGEKVRVDVRCTSTAEQQAAAEAGMESRQREEDEISFAMPGAPELIAGVVVQVKGWGVFDRDYLVKESRHSIARGEGYTVELKLQKSLKATEEASS